MIAGWTVARVVPRTPACRAARGAPRSSRRVERVDELEDEVTPADNDDGHRRLHQQLVELPCTRPQRRGHPRQCGVEPQAPTLTWKPTSLRPAAWVAAWADVCPEGRHGLCSGPAHSPRVTLQRPFSTPLHQPAPSNRAPIPPIVAGDLNAYPVSTSVAVRVVSDGFPLRPRPPSPPKNGILFTFG
jgi:hypothetical protein